MVLRAGWCFWDKVLNDVLFRKLTARLHLKLDGWKTIVSFAFGIRLFFRGEHVSLKEGKLFGYLESPTTPTTASWNLLSSDLQSCQILSEL